MLGTLCVYVRSSLSPTADNVDVDVSDVTLPEPLLEARSPEETKTGPGQIKDGKQAKTPTRPPPRPPPPKAKDETVRLI